MNKAEDTKSTIWQTVASPKDFAFPIFATMCIAGMAGFYDKINFVAMLLMLLCAICLQLLNNASRELGNVLDQEAARTKYYELKFAYIKHTKDSIDPITGTAGNYSTFYLKSIFICTAALAIVLGYGLILICMPLDAWQAKIIVLTALIVVIVLIALRYMGTWKYGYKSYGDLILFAANVLLSIAGFYIFTNAFVLPVLYASIGIGALGVAQSNMRNMWMQNFDADFAETDTPRNTIPLAAGLNGAKMLQIVSLVLGMIWLVAFPVSIGSVTIANYAFCLLYIPIIRDIFALKNVKPSDTPHLRLSLSVSLLLLGVAFFFSMSAGNLGAFFAFLII